MTTVVPFRARTSEHRAEEDDGLTSEGAVRCMNCSHEWQAAAPIGTLPLECPSCGSMKGLWKHFYSRGFGDEDRPPFTCRCGCELFSITPRGIYCPNCGRSHRPYDQPTGAA